jgi:hypothetical protein
MNEVGRSDFILVTKMINFLLTGDGMMRKIFPNHSQVLGSDFRIAQSISK